MRVAHKQGAIKTDAVNILWAGISRLMSFMSSVSQMVIHEAESEIHIGTDSLNILLFPLDWASVLQKSSGKSGLMEHCVNTSHSSEFSSWSHYRWADEENRDQDKAWPCSHCMWERGYVYIVEIKGKKVIKHQLTVPKRKCLNEHTK